MFAPSTQILQQTRHIIIHAPWRPNDMTNRTIGLRITSMTPDIFHNGKNRINRNDKEQHRGIRRNAKGIRNLRNTLQNADHQEEEIREFAKTFKEKFRDKAKPRVLGCDDDIIDKQRLFACVRRRAVVPIDDSSVG